MRKILDAYFTSPERLRILLWEMDREIVVDSFVDILHRYANDVNSSSLRELYTILKAGYEPRSQAEKLGYNGIFPSGKPCDVKPINIRKDSGRKLDGGGNFSDFTYERLERYLKDEVMLLVSGFIDGQLIYILEFPFSYLEGVIHHQLDKFFTHARQPGQYLRSASFSFTHYKDCQELKVIYRNPNLEEFHRFLRRGLFTYLGGQL